MRAQPDVCSEPIRDWLLSRGLRVKALYRVTEVARLLDCDACRVKRSVTIGEIDVVSYSDLMPGSRLIRVPWAEIERLAGERGIA
jgi:hypothetical protein